MESVGQSGNTKKKPLSKTETIAEYSQLTGLNESELVNRLLADSLRSHALASSGESEWFLGTLSYPDRQRAERVLARVTVALWNCAISVILSRWRRRRMFHARR
jgi:N-glycosylase/DNA lyase